MKCRQRVCRPLGEISPLSDRAPRDNCDVGRPSQYEEAKATPSAHKHLAPRGPRAWHVDIVVVGTWENLRGIAMMQNYAIKKDNFKTSKFSFKVVRLICSSKEVG